MHDGDGLVLSHGTLHAPPHRPSSQALAVASLNFSVGRQVQSSPMARKNCMPTADVSKLELSAHSEGYAALNLFSHWQLQLATDLDVLTTLNGVFHQNIKNLKSKTQNCYAKLIEKRLRTTINQRYGI